MCSHFLRFVPYQDQSRTHFRRLRTPRSRQQNDRRQQVECSCCSDRIYESTSGCEEAFIPGILVRSGKASSLHECS